MKYTLRRFTCLSIVVEEFTPKQLKDLHDILENIGGSVTYFFLNAMGKTIKVYQSALIDWLNLMPNLNHIASGGLFGCQEILDAPNTEVNIDKLENVQLCPMGLGVRLHETPASSVTWLQFNDTVPLPNVDKIFLKHRETLSRLDLFRTVYTDPKPFRHLKLRRLTMLYQQYMNNSAHDQFLLDVIEHQKELQYLSLGECDLCSNSYPVSPEVLRKISTKSQLTELNIGLSQAITPAHIWNLSKLTKLVDLTIQMAFDDYSVENQNDIVDTLCSTKLPELESLRLLTCGANLSLNNFFDSFANLSELDLCSESTYSFSPGRLYPNMTKLSLYNEHFEPIDIFPSLIKSMPNLCEFKINPLFPRVSTFRAIFNSNICVVDILVAIVENVSLYKMKKIKKLCKKIEDKCGDEHCEIEFEDDEGGLEHDEIRFEADDDF